MTFSLAEVFLLVWSVGATVLAVGYRTRVKYVQRLLIESGVVTAALIFNEGKREEARQVFAVNGITSEEQYKQLITKK